MRAARIKRLIIFAMTGLILSACVPTMSDSRRYTATPEKAVHESAEYALTLTPNLTAGKITTFTLDIDNRSEKPIEIDWNKTLFVRDGQTSGGFIYEGIIYADRNNPRFPDIVFPNAKFSKVISPSNLVDYIPPTNNSGIVTPGGWISRNIPAGASGAYVTIRHRGQEFGHRLSLTIQVIANTEGEEPILDVNRTFRTRR